VRALVLSALGTMFVSGPAPMYWDACDLPCLSVREISVTFPARDSFLRLRAASFQYVLLRLHDPILHPHFTLRISTTRE